MFEVNNNKKTIGAYVEAHFPEMNTCKTKADVVAFIEKGRNDTNSNYLDNTLLPAIKAAHDLKRAMIIVGNTVCAGRNLRVI